MTTHEMTTPEPARAAGNHHPAASYALSPCFLACFGGWTLNAMDVLIIRPAMPGIIESFPVTKPDVVLIGTATLLTSAFGGWLAGALSDRVGRKPTLQWMILLFAGCTGLCGLAQDYFQLFLLRVLTGIGFGGQWAAAAVMVGETCDKAHRGRWVGFLQWIPAYETIIVWLAFPLGFFASGTFAGMGAFFTELFPTRMSGSGVGFTYNFGRGFAALILWLIPGLAGARLLSGLWASLLSLLPPELSTLLKINSELGLSIGVFVLIAYGLVFIATLLLPETRGRALDTKAE